LQDHKRAVVVGERSYGKGSVQNIVPMENGTSALKLTTASYWRPSGKNIHRFPDSKETDEWGVKPDQGFEVPLELEEMARYLNYRRDRDVVHGKDGVAPAPKANPSEEDADGKEPKGKAEAKDKKPFQDRALQKALDYIHNEMKKVVAVPETANT
jgi:carboxyl-terminal processing protease